MARYGDTDLYAQGVYQVLKNGASRTISTGEKLSLAPQDVDVPQTYTVRSGKADYGPASWHPAASGNFTNSNREATYDINKVVIHIAQGTYAGTVNYFQTPRADVSAHYVVSRGGAVAQCAHNEDIAYHAGYWATNCHSIGIEHAGYCGNPGSITRAEYRASARLTAWCCKKFRIPIDRRHVIGHYQVPGCPGYGGGSDCHTDPQPYWKWAYYMDLVHYYRRRL